MSTKTVGRPRLVDRIPDFKERAHAMMEERRSPEYMAAVFGCCVDTLLDTMAELMQAKPRRTMWYDE